MPKEKLEQGVVESYIHSNKKIGVLLELKTKTDFASRTEIFKNLAHEVAMQIAAMDPKNVEGLSKQEYIRDSSRTSDDSGNKHIKRKPGLDQIELDHLDFIYDNEEYTNN